MSTLKTVFLLLCILFFSGIQAQENGYEIKVKIEGVNEGDTIYLANYFGKKLFYSDTAYVKKSTVVFEGDSLKGGKYAVVLPDVKYFEIIVAEDVIEMETDAHGIVTYDVDVDGSELHFSADGKLLSKESDDDDEEED